MTHGHSRRDTAAMVVPGQHLITTTLALAALLTLAAPAYTQSDEAATRAQLQQLEKDIARIQKEIGSAGSERDKLQSELRSAEVQLGKLLRDIKRSERDIAGSERELKTLEAEQAKLTTARDEQQARIKTELNAATDNPIFPDGATVPALHGGNFMGQHVALVSDALSQAICVLAGLAERQVARVTDERLNGGLPAFLHDGRAGLNSGFMGAQVTATSLLAEMRSQGAVSSQSISTNGANQDVVSMGTIAARNTRRQLRRCSEILAILALSVAQGLSLADRMGRGRQSSAADALQAQIRQVSPALQDDRPLSGEIAQLACVLRETDPA